MQSDDDAPATPAGDDIPERFSVDFTGLTLLGHYRVDERMADGGMGSVYLGRDTNLERRVVIKVPHARFLGEAGFRRRFTLEITELVRLEHPNVVGILGQGEHEGVPFFVLQYLGGGSLEDRLTEEGTPPDDLPDVLDWARTIARTLDFIHARGTIHRDVKPGNVLFDEEGHVYLSDFGVAKALESQSLDATEVGTGVGSPRYMAPEQGMGGDLTPSADQYALGSLIYEALAGHPPYREDTALKLLLAKHNSDPEPVDAVVEHVPAAAGAVIARAMAREPEKRFPSCAAFLEALEAALLPKPEPEAVPPARTGKSTLLAVAVGVLLLGAILFLAGILDSEPSGTAEEGAEDSIRLVLLSTGEAPRRTLRYSIEPGQTEHVIMQSSRRLQRIVKGEKIDFMPAPPVVIEGDLRYVEPDRSGWLAFTWTTTRATGKKTPKFDQKKIDNMSETLEPVLSVRGAGRTTSRGTHSSAEIEFADEMTDDVWGYTPMLMNSLRSYPLPLPQEELGVGARWEVTSVEDLFGLRLAVTTTYEILGFDGKRVRLRFNLAQAAHRQPFDAPGLPDHMRSELIRFSGDGVGTTLLDLGSLTATMQAEVDSSMTMRIYLPGKGEGEGEGEGKTLDTSEVAVKTFLSVERR